MFCENYDSFTAALEKRGFTVHTASCSQEAKRIVFDIVKSSSVGFGGSMSVKELDLKEDFSQKGNLVNTHEGAPKETADIERRLAKQADYYICSTNAVTRDGKLINIDGMGNRVSAMIYGPKNIIMIIGKNKLVNSIDEGIERIRTVACPKNAERLNRNTPCRTTGKCGDCDSIDRMCNVISILEHKTSGIASFHLVLVDCELGY
ncbi:MAG: lactate utilization protein [Clostridia bacterium]|nr:lactate utilization protein [Clostridia bacterium]